jgi:nitrite reductase/ring-hydroxylating ferredoxin subunit
MNRSVEYFRIGRTDDIERQGIVRVNLLGNRIAVLPHNNDFIAIELSTSTTEARAFLPDRLHFSYSGTKSPIKRLLSDSGGKLWGKIRQFPVKVEDGYVLVGIAS